ncbi:hypothetical protein AS850_05230 [Frondihabitans sp. 762G35]|nr:hypothetical protein AS850_05230 [Frondihabitans sp. 762G35]
MGTKSVRRTETGAHQLPSIPVGRGQVKGPPGTLSRVTILIDEPVWPAHDTLWAHLVSDESYEELHAFASLNGIPRRGFDHDHYDVPAARHDELVRAGAQAVGGKELAVRLEASGLRVPQWRKRQLS